MVGYIFGGKTGETQDSLKQKRLAALALMQQGDAPKNVGEGLAAVGRALSGRFALNYLDKKDASLKKEGDSVFNALFSGGPSAPSTGSSVPMPGAAAEVSASSPALKPVQTPAFANDGTELGSYLSDPTRRSTLPAGMRNNNPGNIKFVGQKVPGIVGPSSNTDQGDPQAVFATPEAGMAAMYGLLGKKYAGGKRTPNQMIAGNMGWTPGNYEAAKNVAAYAGIGPDDDINFSDPAMAAKFMRGLIIQEHGNKGSLYPESMISSITGATPQGGAQVASAQPMTATDAIAAQAPLPGGNDPGINISQRAPMPQGPSPVQTALMQGPQPQAPQLPPPTNVAAPPQVAQVAPMPIPQPQQMAQAPQTAPQPSPAQALAAGPTVQQLMVVAQNPNISDEQRGIVNMMLKQKMDQQQAGQERALKMSDPGYQADLALKQAQLKDLTNPSIKPADQARIDIEKQKADFEQNGISKADQEKMKFEREKFYDEQKKGQWAKLTDGRLYNETTGEFRDAPPPVPGSTPAKMDDVSGIRKEIQQLPSYKNLSQAAPIYKSMVETAGRNSKASDLNLVYGLGKIMDPTSVVREGEMVMVKNTASLPDWLVGAANTLNGGAALQPDTRQAILTEAYGRVKGYNDEFNQQMGQYGDIAKRNSINVDDIIPKFGEFKPWSPEQNNAPNISTDWSELSPGVRIRKVN